MALEIYIVECSYLLKEGSDEPCARYRTISDGIHTFCELCGRVEHVQCSVPNVRGGYWFCLPCLTCTAGMAIKEDPRANPALHTIIFDGMPMSDLTEEEVRKLCSRYSFRRGFLMLHGEERDWIVLPPYLKDRLIEECHACL